jgi:SAM-dependent methyltransferase
MEPAEVERLERQHETWRGPTERAWRLAGFRAGQTVVDLGCGPGFSALDLASLVGTAGRVVAVDSSPIATDYLRRSVAKHAVRNLDVITADASSVDLSVWKPSGIFARWLFCFLPHPEVVVRHVGAALPRGGTFAVMDYWNYLAIQTEPAAPLFQKVFRAVYESFADAGGSLDVAGTVPALYAASGIRVTATEPLCQVGGPGSAVWRWISDFQDLYLPTLVEKAYLTRAEAQDYAEWWAAQGRNPHALVFSPPILCVVGEKI